VTQPVEPSARAVAMSFFGAGIVFGHHS
jgi:hypothetical protein